jgi:hypothetical protein
MGPRYTVEAKQIPIFFVFAKLFKFFDDSRCRLQREFKITAVAYSGDFESPL